MRPSCGLAWRCVFIFFLACCVAPRISSEYPKVGIIGAGIGGAASAYFLRDKGYQIDVYEASQEIGGRIQELVYHNQAFERGAAMIWEHNLYMARIAAELGLLVKQIDGSGGLAIFDGQNIVFSTSSSWLSKVKTIWRYGLSPLVYGRHALKVWKEHFFPIYKLQEDGVGFQSPEEMLQQLGLYNLTQETCIDHAKEVLLPWSLWGTAAFMDELAAAINRCNYNQRNSQLNALAGLVSFLPAAAGSIWAIEGGNRRAASAMFKASGATLHKPCTVQAIHASEDGKFFLLTQCGDMKELQGPFDSIIVAAPLELANITFSRPTPDSKASTDTVASQIFDQSDRGSIHASERTAHMEQYKTLCKWFRCEPSPQGVGSQPGGGGQEGAEVAGDHPTASDVPEREFQTTVTTYVRGTLQKGFFGVAPGESMPETVFLTEHADSPISSVALKYSGQEGHVYKAFSQQPLEPNVLEQLFSAEYSVLSVDDWKAYPKFSPPERFAPFELAPGIFYNNAIENAASAMEMSVIVGVNSAILAAKHVNSKTQCQNPDCPEWPE